jgi:hypothetical protein
MPPILHGDIYSNSNNNSNIDNCDNVNINVNVNDYLHYQIFVKNKKNKKINIKKHIEFISKHCTLQKYLPNNNNNDNNN